MGLESWADYQKLMKSRYFPRKYLFAPGITGGHVNRLNSRVRLAKSF